MVLALLEGRKTQTRRLATSPLRRCEVGDLLYVREAFGVLSDKTENVKAESSFSDYCVASQVFIHRAGWDHKAPPDGWRPSIHMPRDISRMTLRITEVRFEPVDVITARDAWAEGVEGNVGAIRKFRELWDSLHNKPGERWADRPDVVALSFEVMHGDVDRLDAQKEGGAA
jgi:hypothetical protein